MLRTVFWAAPVGICILKDRVFVRANDYWCDHLGYSEEALLGRTSRFLYESDEEYERVGRLLYTHARVEGKSSVRTRLRRGDGEVIDVILTIAPIRTEDPAYGTVGIVHDVTEIQQRDTALELINQDLECRMERCSLELRSAQERLQSKEQELRDFAHSVSHELKSYLIAISGYAHEMQQTHYTELSARGQLCLNRLLAGTAHLHRVAEELLTFSRRDHGVRH